MGLMEAAGPKDQVKICGTTYTLDPLTIGMALDFQRFTYVERLKMLTGGAVTVGINTDALKKEVRLIATEFERSHALVILESYGQAAEGVALLFWLRAQPNHEALTLDQVNGFPVRELIGEMATIISLGGSARPGIVEAEIGPAKVEDTADEATDGDPSPKATGGQSESS